MKKNTKIKSSTQITPAKKKLVVKTSRLVELSPQQTEMVAGGRDRCPSTIGTY